MKFVSGATLALILALGGNAIAQTEQMSADNSDPAELGWMQGFPPAAERIIRFTDPDYFQFPKLRWTVCHFRELMPTSAVRNGVKGSNALPEALDPSIDDVTFIPTDGSEPMTWRTAFDANYTDGVIVLHHGRIVYERYDGCLSEYKLHGAMSVTKSLTGLLAEILVSEGSLSESATVGDLIPELDSSAFGDATVRQVMNMTTALDYSEDYADPDAEIWTYAKAGSPLPKPDGYKGPRSYYEFLETLQKNGAHGTAFGYRTVNADALGWLIARGSGQSVADLLSERIWSRIGTEREAFYTVDSIGTPFAGGGFNATLRDMARLGQLLLSNGRLDGEQLIPQAAISSIRAGGDPEIFAKAGFDLPGWSYRSMWWITNDDHGAYAARGVHGQTIWIDPTADMVIVRFASHPVAANSASDATSLPAYRAVADYLMARGEKSFRGHEWLIENIAGQKAVDDRSARLTFSHTGKMSGNLGCNRLSGSYRTDGQSMTIHPSGRTMMACGEALMHQEETLLNVLQHVESYDFDERGALVLESAGGEMIVARRH